MIRQVLSIPAALLVTLSGLAVGSETKIDGRIFTLPDGFTIERVAGPPLVDRPIVADLDERGRLYVADSSGSNEKVEKQLKDRTHRIVRLSDADGDGVYESRTVFADRMMFPEGALWRDGSLYVAAPPSIWKLTDTDDDGVADVRVEWFDGKTLTGCANDLHGPYEGPDGRIYWCKGAFARQTYDRPGKPPFSTRAAHIFRARPDATGIEPVMTGGMDNPVDVVFTRGGERIFTTTFFQHPGGGRRDGLIHDVYGALYGKTNAVLDEQKHTSPDLMPVLTHLGPAAPCGLTHYESDAFGEAFEDNLFACQFNLRKVSRHVLRPEGSTFVTDDFEFLASPDQDFHPTDVIEDADGSLLVVDTGGWYKLCCPSSQLEKADVLGAIYRVRRADAPLDPDPRGLKLDWNSPTSAELASRLDSPRPSVRRRALTALAARGADALPALDRVVRGGASSLARRMALWAATRIEGDDAGAIVREGLRHPEATVRQVALNAISLRRDARAVPALVEILRETSPAIAAAKALAPQPPTLSDLIAGNRRVAAEALGRIGDRSSVPAILDALATPTDRPLDHALTYALIEIADPAATAAGLSHPSPAVRRAALIALDQMDGGGVKVEAVAPFLSASDPALRETAAWVAARHPDWGAALAGHLGERLRSGGRDDPDALTRQLAGFARTPAVASLLAATLRDAQAPVSAKSIALKAMATAAPKEVPGDWVAGLASLLRSADSEGLAAQAVATARTLAIKPLAVELCGALRETGRLASLPLAVRLEALAAVPGGLQAVDPELFALLVARLDLDQPVATRLLAAEVLSHAALTTDQLRSLAGTLAKVGPLEVDRLLGAFEKSSDEAAGRAMIEALTASPTRAGLRIDMIRPRIGRYPASVRERAEALYTLLNADLGKQKARIDELMATLPKGDVRRGQAVFNGTKASCMACHAVGYVGGKVGPDLTRIGSIRGERDLLEAIVYPSASFVRSYEPVVVATRDGKTVNGLVLREDSDGLLLATGPNQEIRIARDQIDEMSPGTVSVMPAGLDQGLTREELADMLAFLQSRK